MVWWRNVGYVWPRPLHSAQIQDLITYNTIKALDIFFQPITHKLILPTAYLLANFVHNVINPSFHKYVLEHSPGAPEKKATAAG